MIMIVKTPGSHIGSPAEQVKNIHVNLALLALRSQNCEKDSSESEPESSILTGFRTEIQTESIFCTRKVNHLPEWRILRRCEAMCVCSHPQEATKRKVLFVGTDCAGERAHL